MIQRLLKWGAPAGLVSALAMTFMVSPLANAATTAVQCSDLSTAVTTAVAGDTLNVTGNCTLTGSILVDKQLTINGVNEATISTSGSTQLFTITAAGTIIQNLNFVKTDKANQIIIGVQANNVSVLDNTFKGMYLLSENDHTSRALVVSPGVTDVTISRNTFENLRQPAYINDFVTGTVSDNYVDQTRGFVVVANSDVTFTGNSWGTNALDIAIIPGAPNNYTCEVVRQIVRDNNNADVQNQAQVTPCPAPTYPKNKDACKNEAYKSFTGVEFKNQGQCVSYVASNGKSNNR
ncbi:hypothetical protein H7Y29_02160 [Microbacteriaceae bacterium]|nr:hypothetical protein [Candidatus Saccharibacteria bacterium]